MKTFRNNRAWRRFRLNIKDTNLEISANISSLDESHDAVYELEQEIVNVFRIHHTRTLGEHSKRAHVLEHREELINGHFKPKNGFGDILS